MLAIIGLGNPGEKYDHTRHNAGFDVVTMLSALWDIPLKKLKCKALIGEGTAEGQKIVLIKPQTFMNESGLSVAEVLNWFKLRPQEVLIIVDDIDLPFGQVRVRSGGGPGTHNGMRSILQCTGSADFPRIRVGMGAPPAGWEVWPMLSVAWRGPQSASSFRVQRSKPQASAGSWRLNGGSGGRNTRCIPP